jgi:hypothetical protein
MVGGFDIRCGLFYPMGNNQGSLPWKAYLTLTNYIMTINKLSEVLS